MRSICVLGVIAVKVETEDLYGVIKVTELISRRRLAEREITVFP